jgi:hypothetical protein
MGYKGGLAAGMSNEAPFRARERAGSLRSPRWPLLHPQGQETAMRLAVSSWKIDFSCLCVGVPLGHVLGQDLAFVP